MLTSLLWLSLTSLIYALLHSLLAMRRVKAWGEAHLPGFRRWYRLAYNLFALLSLLPLLYLYWTLPDRHLYTLSTPVSWGMVAVQVGGVIGLIGALLQGNPAYFIGLAQLAGDPDELGDRLVARGIYRLMRHPLYTFSMVVLWFSPSMSASQLLLNVLATLYFYVGSLHEERRLYRLFGNAYARYAEQTPRFLPRLG